MITNTDQRYLSMAANISRKSPVLMQHGSVAVASGKIMATGYNNYRTSSNDGFISNVCTCRAEVDVLSKLYHSCNSNTFGKHSSNIKVA